MPSVEIYGSGYAALISYNVSQNVAANYSVVRVNRVQMRSLTSMNRNCYIKGSIYVNGDSAPGADHGGNADSGGKAGGHPRRAL